MCRLGLCFSLFLGCLFAFRASAHETDQFTIPDEREWADIGPYLSRWFYVRIEHAVDKTNASIRKARESGGDVAQYHSGDHMARAGNGELPWAMDVIEGFDKLVLSDEMYHRHPGRIVGYKEPFENILQRNHFILDPRQFFRLFLACTVKAYGVHFGTDKIGHFTDMGMNYYREYAKARASGMDPDAAERRATEMGQRGLIFSERGMLGFMTAGAYSNGDLASNYVGLLFYRNLTEPVFLKGEVRPPMLVLDGDLWRFNDHVRRNSDFFAVFISEHFDEALNPSLFEAGMRNAVRGQVRDRAPRVLRHYADASGSIRPPEYFDKKVVELSTYHGRDYGHMGKPEELVSIGSTCFTAEAVKLAARALSPVQPVYLSISESNPAPELRDGFNTTSLHIAARQKDPAPARRLIDAGATVNAEDDFGVTPLHDAARSGADEVALLLIRAGARVNAADDYGTTPLHLACREGHPIAARLLIDAGASINAASAAGATPLHEAALNGDKATTLLLLSRNADRAAQNKRGQTPAAVADSRGYSNISEIIKGWKQ